MILEVAILNVKSGEGPEFETTFAKAQEIIAASEGYLGHELQRCLEIADQYILLVKWNTLEAHTEGFRGSANYQEWKKLLHHFYEPFPTVLHYSSVF
ncbi:MAG: antibiotic biosynthesis monooxygenase [Bacteroidota bacterium]